MSEPREPAPMKLIQVSDLHFVPPGTLLLGLDPRARLEAAGARVIPVRARDGRVDLPAAWRRLGGLGVNDLLVEGGGGLAAALLRAGLVDRLLILLAPLLIGGDGRPVFGPLGVRRLSQAYPLSEPRVRRLGPDLLLEVEC